VEDVPSPDGVAGNLCDHRLRESANLDLQVEDIESTDALARDVVVTDVPVVAANALIAAGTESVGSRTGQDDRADRDVVASEFEGS